MQDVWVRKRHIGSADMPPHPGTPNPVGLTALSRGVLVPTAHRPPPTAQGVVKLKDHLKNQTPYKTSFPIAHH
jgi:hypothetical protein